MTYSVMYTDAQLTGPAPGVWARFLAGERVTLLGLRGRFVLDRSDPRGIWRAS